MRATRSCPRLQSLFIVLVALSLAALGCNMPASVEDEGEGVAEPVEEDEAGEEGIPLVGEASFPELALCAGPQPALITDLAVYQTPDLAEPAARAPFRDPVFGTCLIRVTDRDVELADDDDSGGLKNEYSRVQSFNTDGSLLVARGTEATWYLYDVASLRPLGQLPIEVEPRWDADDPHLIYFIDETRLMALDVGSGERRTVHDFAHDLEGQSATFVWTRYEGSPSFDTCTWGLMAQDDEGTVLAFLIYDLADDRVTATRPLSAGYEVDSVTISPLGTYFLAYFDTYCERGTLGDDAHPCGLMVYDRDLQNGRSLVRIIGHSDTALDAAGREVLIYQEIDTDHIALLDLDTGAVAELFPIDFSHSPIGLHFSGRASRMPGWALVSTYSGGHPDDATWMDDGVFAVELQAGGRVVRLAHTHSLVDEDQEHDYWAEPQASASPDLTRVVFTTNWGRSGTDEVEIMMIVLPDGWTETLQ
jgi:hypothetical protein